MCRAVISWVREMHHTSCCSFIRHHRKSANLEIRMPWVYLRLARYHGLVGVGQQRQGSAHLRAILSKTKHIGCRSCQRGHHDVNSTSTRTNLIDVILLQHREGVSGLGQRALGCRLARAALLEYATDAGETLAPHHPTTHRPNYSYIWILMEHMPACTYLRRKIPKGNVLLVRSILNSHHLARSAARNEPQEASEDPRSHVEPRPAPWLPYPT